MLGHPQVDLMATADSTQVSQYFLAVVDEEAMGINAFTKNWSRLNLACFFPPPPMVPLILNRIYQCSEASRFIVIMVNFLYFPGINLPICFSELIFG